jgi:Outer membrane cobalamin receptor protein
MHNQSNKLLKHAIRIALTGGALVTAGAAYGQAAPAPASEELEEVLVTGSRIAAAPNAVSISPVVALSGDQIQQKGITRVEDMLSSLPQVYANQNSSVSNGSDGTATVDLRNLGAQRTLVLVNGRRLGPGDPGSAAGGASDLNQVPAQLVERVEVLTGGASSVYGADAVAGVVNFVLNDHFEGVQFTANYGMYVHSQNNPDHVQEVLSDFNEANGTDFKKAPSNAYEGQTQDYAAMFGFNTEDGNGNLTSYVTYRTIEGVLQSQYDYSAATLASGYKGTTASGSVYDGRFTVSGSSTSARGRYRLVSATGVNIGGSKGFVENASGQYDVAPFDNSMRYNFGPTNYYMRPDDRWTAGAFAHYEFSEHANVFAELQYVNDHTKAQIAPSGSFYGSLIAATNCGNPLFSQSMVDSFCGGSTDPNTTIHLLVGRRNVEGAPRVDDIRHSAWRFVLGSKGAINDAWDYEAYGQVGLTELTENYENDVSSSRVKNALDIVDVNGTPTCRSVVLGYDASCVPWNIWQPGGVTQQALDYIAEPLLSNGKVTQYIFNANTTGDLGKYGVQIPMAESGLKTNVGIEFRNVKSELNTDQAYITGDASGQGSPTLPTSGSINAKEIFGELRLPIIDKMTGAYALAAEAGYRYSDYNLGFSTDTYKFGLEWSPLQSIRLRGSYARAVRAPNAYELYNPTHVGLNGSSDPCAGTTLTPANWAAECLQQGLTLAQYGTIDPNPAAQYNGQIGGNPDLQPEKATTVSFGIGWTPEFAQGLRVQLDYFDIKIEDVIRRVGQDTTLALCGVQNVFCERIHRDVNGTIWVQPNGYVEDPLDNNGQLHEKGVDAEVAYTFDIGSAGSLALSLMGTYVDSYKVLPLQSLPDTEYDCKGLYGNTCTTPTPEWRHTFTATWNTPWRDLSLTAAWRYTDSVTLDSLDSNPNLDGTQGGACTVSNACISNTDAKIDSRDYIDLSASMALTEQVSLRLGINNVLDTDPPIIGQSNASGGNGNTYPQMYDALGRYMFATATIQF